MSDHPSEWRVETIGDICEIHDSKRIPLSSEQRRDRKGPYPYYGANNIQDSIDEFIFDFDAVLLAEDGGYYDEYETRDIAQYATGRYWVNNHAHILTGSESLDTRFLYYSLVRKNICPWINTGTRAKLNQADLRQIEIAVPPLPEQKQIAEILSGIDTGIYYHKARAKKCEELIAATEASTFEVFRKDDLGQQGRAERNGKEAIALGDIFEFRNGLNYSKANTGKGLKVVGVGDFKNYRTPKYGLLGELSPEGLDFNSSLLEEGDFLFVRSNGNRLLIGRCLSIEKIPTGAPVVHSGFTIRARSKNQHAYSHNYIKQLLQSRVFRRSVAGLGGGTNISNLSQDILSETMIALPSIQRQEKESSGLLAIQEFYEHTQNKLIQLEAMKVAVSSDLLSGRKRVSV